MDRLPVIYHAVAVMPLKVDLLVVCREKGFGKATALLQAKLTDNLSDCKIPCSGTWVHELWQPSAKATITSGHKLHTTVPNNTDLPGNHSISTKQEETNGTSKVWHLDDHCVLPGLVCSITKDVVLRTLGNHQLIPMIYFYATLQI